MSKSQGLRAAQENHLSPTNLTIGLEPAQLPLLRVLPPASRKALLPVFMHKKYMANEFICRQDDEDKDILIMTRGIVQVWRDFGGRDVKLEELEAPNVVGEMSFIDDQPRSASVLTVTEVEGLLLPFESFQKLMVEEPIIAFQFLFGVGRLVSRRLRATIDHIAHMEDPQAAFERCMPCKSEMLG